MIPSIQNLTEQPIPGYRLIERLGRGGFGEVWKAEAPGGLMKAIKFVFGDLEGVEGESATAEQELKALNRVKGVRHPFILSLERVDIIEGQLMIVMELADRNLWDRFKECRQQDLPGVPREELLGYMGEAAEALDLMNLEYQLQHLDIKPQNLFLVRNHVKVADFGLVKDFEGKRGSVTGGVTPLYAAPETFDGYISRFSDQYSLAIVYQELLTGVRPFNGSNARQLLMQHLQVAPNLLPLLPGDQAAVGRALAKKPDERFPTCTDFVAALRNHGGAMPLTRGSGVNLSRGTVAEHDSVSDTGMGQMVDALRDDLAPESTQAPSRKDQDEDELHTPDTLPPRQLAAEDLPEGSGTINLRPPGAAGAVHLAKQAVARQVKPERTPSTPKARPQQAAAATQVPPLPEGIDRERILFPALVVGLGQVGMQVVQRLREGLHDRFGSFQAVPHLRFLGLDTDPDAIHQAVHAGSSGALNGGEVLLARLSRPSHYLRPREGQVPLQSWFDPRVVYRIPRIPSTQSLRALGRLAFCDNYRLIAQRIRTELEGLSQEETLAEASRATGLGIRGQQPRIYVVSSLAGGTGSGMFLDLAYLIRDQLDQLDLSPELVGLFLMPEVNDKTEFSPALANTHAALTELNHFSSPDTTFSARYDTREPPVSNPAPPFDHCVLLPLPSPGSGIRERPAKGTGAEGLREDPLSSTIGLAAGYLHRDLSTAMGRTLEGCRHALATPVWQDGLVCQTFGLYRMTWPRRTLIRKAAHNLCERLLKRWTSKGSKQLRDTIQSLVTNLWTNKELAPQGVKDRLDTICEETLKESPESAFETMTCRIAVRGPQGVTLDVVAAKGALERFEALLGQPQDSQSPPGMLVGALDAVLRPIATSCEQKLAELAVSLMEKPGYRLAGAEEAIRQIIAVVEKIVQDLEATYGEATARAAELNARIQGQLASLQSGSAPSKRKPAQPTDLVEMLRRDPLIRYEALLHSRLLTIYRTILSDLPEYLREVGLCRVHLNDLLRTWETVPCPERLEVDLGPTREVFPAGCKSLEQTIEQLLQGISEEEMLDLDQRVQDAVKKQFKALITACIAGPKLFKTLHTVIQEQAEDFVAHLLVDASAGELYLNQQSQATEPARDLETMFGQAAPALAAGGQEIQVLTVPPGPAGEQLRALVSRSLADTRFTCLAGHDEVVIYREQPRLRIAELPQLGPSAHETCRLMTARQHFSAHNRSDIPSWMPARPE